jgi:ribosomal protein S24E
MTAKLISEKIHALMKRKEVTLEFEHQKKPTPKTDEAVKVVAQATKSEEKLVSIKHISNAFGSNKAIIKAYVYQDEKSKIAAEKVNKKKFIKAEIKTREESAKKAAEETTKKPEDEEQKPAPEEKKEIKPVEEKKE